MRCVLLGLCLLLLPEASGAQVQPGAQLPSPDPAASPADQALAAYTSPRLTRFTDEKDFAAYRYAAARARGEYSALRRVRYASLQDVPPPPPECTPDDPDCPRANEQNGANRSMEEVVVTGSLARAPTNPSITNNQMANVEEGDIVKQIDHFLVVLQDGRLFVIDLRAGGGRDLAVADRQNVYRHSQDVDWYDEMLVQGDRILVTAYSYQQQATELTVFRLDTAGRLSREGVFYMSSNDYYSTTNYATRIVGGNLVVYTPLELSGPFGQFPYPVVRRWVDGESRAAAERRGRPMFAGRDIYRPVRTIHQPMVHTISVCPLTTSDGADLQCRSTAFVAERTSQFYVNDEGAYLWTSGRWEESERDGREQPSCAGPPHYAPTTIFRVPISGAAPEVAGAIGLPIDQFSIEASRGEFRALTRGERFDCEPVRRRSPLPLAYLSFPTASFGEQLREVPAQRYTPLPTVRTNNIANRFAERWLVYGGLPDGGGEAPNGQPAAAFAVPLARPGSPVALDLDHSVIRAERMGDDIVLTGYAGRDGLSISYIDLRGRAQVSSTQTLFGRFESEGRSHAFNSRAEQDGSGMLGLPTVAYPAWRSVSRSLPSDISYLTVSRSRQLRNVGRLDAAMSGNPDDEHANPDYQCEVSCVDWYGNSRPIFTEGRIFALSGTELVEGELGGSGQIRERRRLDITQPVGSFSRTTRH